MEPLKREIELDDGRSLDVWEAGELTDVPLLSLHGTPGAGLPNPFFVDRALDHGMRWVSYSRPGYGDSSRSAGRAVADCVPDVRQIIDQLGIERTYVVGGSGGGPHALACAALLPDRVIAAATVASPAPFDAEGLDFLAGTGPENVEEIGAAIQGEEELQRYLEREVVPLVSLKGEDVAASLGGLVSGPDKAVLTGPYADAMATVLRESVRTGIWGWFDDDMAFIRDWGFDLASLHVPVMLWHGDEDLMSPVAHGRWLAGHIPGVQPRIEPGAGHISIAVFSYGRILDSLLTVP